MTQRIPTVTIDTSSITSAQSILDELSALSDRLPGTNLSNLLVFNNAYLTVTKTIAEASKSNRFKNSDFIERFSICFAIYYFDAINMYSRSDPALASAWSKTIQPAGNAQSPAFVSLLMGANAHINYDLPFALADTIRSGKNNNFLKDISTIDKLLMKSGKQIIGEFDEPNALVDFIKRKARFLYFRPIMYMILYWRIVAWREYRAIKKRGVDTGCLARRSTKIANRLVWLGSRLS